MNSVNFDKLPRIDPETITKVAKDAAYITVGLAVLAVQKVQVRREELNKTFNDQFRTGKESLESLTAKFETSWAELDKRLLAIETKIDTAVEQLEGKLPERAGALLGQAHDATKAARQQVRDILTPAAA